MDLETGAVLGVTVASGAAGDTETILETLPQAGEHIAEIACITNKEEVGERVQAGRAARDSGRQGISQQRHIANVGGSRSPNISEPDRGQRCWKGKMEAQKAVYGNRRRIGGELLRRRGELLERIFAHAYETGGMQRVHQRGRENTFKRILIHIGGFNLSLVMHSHSSGLPGLLSGHSLDILAALDRASDALRTGKRVANAASFCRCVVCRYSYVTLAIGS